VASVQRKPVSEEKYEPLFRYNHLEMNGIDRKRFMLLPVKEKTGRTVVGYVSRERIIVKRKY
jgi:hypothetical protein